MIQSNNEWSGTEGILQDNCILEIEYPKTPYILALFCSQLTLQLNCQKFHQEASKHRKVLPCLALFRQTQTQLNLQLLIAMSAHVGLGRTLKMLIQADTGHTVSHNVTSVSVVMGFQQMKNQALNLLRHDFLLFSDRQYQTFSSFIQQQRQRLMVARGAKWLFRGIYLSLLMFPFLSQNL